MKARGWAKSEDPGLMQKAVIELNASRRKVRLFAVACCRTVSHLLKDDQVLRALEAAERYAEDRLGENAAMKWRLRVLRQRPGLSNLCVQWTPEYLATGAVASALDRMHPYGLFAHLAVAKAVAATTVKKPNTPKWNEAVEAAAKPLTRLLREIFGNPFQPVAVDPSWLTSDVVMLARGIENDRGFERLPIVADALEEAGCREKQVLEHCRDPGPHVRGCWVIDSLLGLE